MIWQDVIKLLRLQMLFRYDKLVLAGITYNGDLFPCMRAYIEGLTERSYQNRRVAVIENGTWAPMAAKINQGNV